MRRFLSHAQLHVCKVMANQMDLVCRLYEVEAIKFGRFTLKSGIESPVYVDLRVIVSYPKLLAEVSELLWLTAVSNGCKFQAVCGVPYTALPMATCMSVYHGVPMLMRRKEVKTYGTKRSIEGRVREGDECLVIEDVVTSGGSVLETVRALREVGVAASRAVVLLNREQGGRENLEREGVVLFSALTLSSVMECLLEKGLVSSDDRQRVMDFISSHSSVPVPPTAVAMDTTHMSFQHRSEVTGSGCQLSKSLLSLMDSKKTNLALSADVTSSSQLLKLADSVGPHICLLKTHIDILSDFSLDTALQLKGLAEKHSFVIMDDRKYADIGNTVQLQYKRPDAHMIEGWAELVTCHALPGEGVVRGLMGVAPSGSGCVLVCEMSSKGALTSEEYTKAAVEMAEQNDCFVVGLVCRHHLSDFPHIIHMTPGVSLTKRGDSVGQQYLTPEEAVLENGSDLIIVGRGIYEAKDPVASAEQYRGRAYDAYLSRITSMDK